MQEKTNAVSAEVVRIIEEEVRAHMTPFGLREIRVRGGFDHDGDPVIYADVDYDLSENPIDSDVTDALSSTVWDRLWKLGEERFPHIRHHFHEEQKSMPWRRRRKVKA